MAHSLACLRAVQSLDSGVVDLLLGALHGHLNSHQVRNISHQPLKRSLGMHLRQNVIFYSNTILWKGDGGESIHT